jgi:hypothetical protein
MKRTLLSFFFILCIVGPAIAVEVERITLVPRQSLVFVGNVRQALNTTTGSSLVIWDRNNGSPEGHSVWSRLIDADGTPTGSTRQLVKGRNAQSADIAYSDASNQFLLVYANETNGEGRFEIFAQKINSIGKKLGKPKKISPASDRGERIHNYSPRIIYDADTQGFLILWIRYAVAQGVGIQDGLYGTVLNTDLTVRQAPVFMAPLEGDFTGVRGPNISDLGFHPTNGKVLMTGWTQTTDIGFSFQYFLSRFDPDLSPPLLLSKNLKPGPSIGAAPYADLAFLPGNKSQGLFVEGTGVRRRKINAKGAPSGGHSLFFTGAIQTAPLEFPVSALATDGGRAETGVVAIDDSSTGAGSLWFQTAGGAGSALGTPFQLQTNLQITQRPAIFAPPNQPSNGFLYAVIFVDGAIQTSPPTSEQSSGLVLLKVTTP